MKHLAALTCLAIAAAPGMVTSWPKGREYVDPGAVAVDAYDGEVAVTMSGAVNWRRTGWYDVTYRAVDSSGNEAVAVRRVHVTRRGVAR